MINEIIKRLEERENYLVEQFRVACDTEDLKWVSKIQEVENSKKIVQEVAKEYGNNIILDFLQFVRDNADREEFDNKDGWALSDLIILATEYQKGE